MLKKLDGEEYDKFWAEYSTNIKLGVIEDTANKSRLAKLLKFPTSFAPGKSLSTLTEYVSRMKDKQESIYYMAGASREEVETSPFVERLLKKGIEVIYLTEAVDEYCIGALPEFEGKKFQNVAKEGLTLADGKSKEKLDEMKKVFTPLTDWLSNNALKNQVLTLFINAIAVHKINKTCFLALSGHNKCSFLPAVLILCYFPAVIFSLFVVRLLTKNTNKCYLLICAFKLPLSLLGYGSLS